MDDDRADVPETVRDESTPLAGVKVLEFSGLGPTPFGAMLLADLGADVIRIERAGPANPLGGSPDFDFIFRGRPTLSLDLKSASGKQRLTRLVRHADVLIEGFRPGAMERLGAGPDDLCALNDRLIYARMSGWGQHGPLAHKAGHDINYLAVSGGLYPIGPFDGPPTPPLNFVGNFGGGGTFLAMGVLAALHERERSGKGQVIDVAMIDGISVLMTQLAGWMQMGRWNEGRGGNLLDGSAYFYRCYETADRRHVAVGALEKPFHDAFVEGLGLDPEDFADHLDPRCWSARAERIAPIVAQRTMVEWQAVFADRDACVTPVLSLEEAAAAGTAGERASFHSTDVSFQPLPAPRFGRSQTRPPSDRVRQDGLAQALERWGVADDR
ncbi:CaiB/BaiF CoA transferase family protein [Alteriqipengyuania sp. 357]